MKAPLSAAFLDAAAKGFPTTGNGGLGAFPSPWDRSHLTGQKITSEMLRQDCLLRGQGSCTFIDEPPPPRYDLRTLNQVTDVRFQGNCGSCWAHATYASLESTQRMAGLTWNFSENNLKNTHGFDLGHCDGGTDDMSTAYLARWSGPVLEANDPYNPDSSVSPPNLTTQVHVQDVYILPPRANATDNDNIKWFVHDRGAVYSTLYISDTASYNSNTAAYYYNGSQGLDHAIAIVGWDDNYNRNNFTTMPPSNGAFIAKNSWGTGWGERGYFYISYYDSRIGRDDNAVFTARESSVYHRVYQYDPLGRINFVSSTYPASDTAWFANVFTAAENDTLAAVSFYTPTFNSPFQIQVYRDPTDGQPINPEGAATTLTGTIPIPGYHTILLPRFVGLTTGHRFSIVVRLQTPGYVFPMAIEYPDIQLKSSRADSGPNQSYQSSDGSTWTDLTNDVTKGNVCVKGFTIEGSPTPTLISMSPSSATVKGPAFTLTATGNDFTPNSSIRWNYVNRPTTFVSSTRLTAEIPASDIASVGTADVNVFTPAPGGGNSIKQIFTITPVSNPLPVLSSISPTSATAGEPEFTLTVNGNNFIASSVGRWNGADRTTTYVSPTELAAEIQGSDIASAGTASVTVFNPAPDGGTSDAVSFTINPADNPEPSLTSISPTSVTAGEPGFTLTVNGNNFIASSVVRWNGADRTTTFVSPTQLTAEIPASDIATAGMAGVSVFNPAPGGGTSGTVTFTIINPVPALTSISPDSATAGEPGFTLTVNGNNFIASSVVRWNGADRTTTFVSPTQLTAEIPASDIATAGMAGVSVFNPAPGGGTSGTVTFTTSNPVPVPSMISPTSAKAGRSAFTLTVTGSGFLTGSIVQWNGEDRTTAYPSPTQLTAAIPASDVASAGTTSVTVFNPAPGGGTSAAKVFTIRNPMPVLSRISPMSAPAGGSAFTLRVTGSNFIPASKVRWNGGDRTTTFVSPFQLTASIPASDIAIQGTARVTVFNPEPGGGITPAQTFTFQPASTTPPCASNTCTAVNDRVPVAVPFSEGKKEG